MFWEGRVCERRQTAARCAVRHVSSREKSGHRKAPSCGVPAQSPAQVKCHDCARRWAERRAPEASIHQVRCCSSSFPPCKFALLCQGVRYACGGNSSSMKLNSNLKPCLTLDFQDFS